VQHPVLAFDDEQPPEPNVPAPAIPAQVKRSKWWYVGLGFAILLFIAVATLLVASIPDPQALAICIVAAALPAAFYVWVVLRLDPFEVEPRHLLLAAFGWGAVGAVIFSIIFTLIFEISIGTTGSIGADAFISTAIGAPIVEETCKGLVLLALFFFYRQEFDNVLDGIVYGAVVGIGFAMTENILYFGIAYLEGGFSELGELFLARSVIFGFGHAIYSATFGASLGWSREQYARGAWRFIVPILGWALAVFQHMLWNGGVLITNGLLGEDAGVLPIVLIDAILFVVPALLVLVTIARVAHRRELGILRAELANEVDRRAVTPGEYEMLFRDDLRRQALAEASARGGSELRRAQQRFFDLAAELAFRQYHLRQGEDLKPGQLYPEDAYRAELARLRAVLATAGLPPTVSTVTA
jgi:RsiW-degrading membrane proteinase PrsW (M82 family)